MVECNYTNDKIDKIYFFVDDEKRNVLLENNCELIVWKACKTIDDINVYVEILIPKEAKRITLLSNNYNSRIECGNVVSIKDKYSNEYTEAYSFLYKNKIK